MTAHHRKEWTPEEDQALIAAYQAGEQIKVLARQCGRSVRAVEIHLERLRTLGLCAPGRRGTWTQEEMRQARDLRAEGLAWPVIARRLGRRTTTTREAVLRLAEQEALASGQPEPPPPAPTPHRRTWERLPADTCRNELRRGAPTVEQCADAAAGETPAPQARHFGAGKHLELWHLWEAANRRLGERLRQEARP